MPLPGDLRRLILSFQRNEITEHHVYLRLAKLQRGENRDILERIGRDELEHYKFWRRYTGVDVGPNRLKLLLYLLMARLLGITFALKLMERGEEGAQESYSRVLEAVPEAKPVLEDEERHEQELVRLIREERLQYIGSMVLGLNDALVELTGAVAGLSMTLQNTKLVAVAGAITGIAASLSMAASEYLSQKSEGAENPGKAALYTGAAYVTTVFVLVAPFFALSSYMAALALALFDALVVILVFTFFVSVVRETPFWRRFAEAVAISFGVAALSFAFGVILRGLVGVELD